MDARAKREIGVLSILVLWVYFPNLISLSEVFILKVQNLELQSREWVILDGLRKFQFFGGLKLKVLLIKCFGVTGRKFIQSFST